MFVLQNLHHIFIFPNWDKGNLEEEAKVNEKEKILQARNFPLGTMMDPLLYPSTFPPVSRGFLFCYN